MIYGIDWIGNALLVYYKLLQIFEVEACRLIFLLKKPMYYIYTIYTKLNLINNKKVVANLLSRRTSRYTNT